ncbi:MAG: MCE family protein [Bacteroidetes bacterium]|nr:MCE family protein [Bacteroidota bacterium]
MKISNELKVGALTLIGIVVLIMGFYYLKGEELFSKTQKIYVLLEDAAGITAANPVAMYGKQIGKVSTVTFKETGNYNVIFDLSISKDIKIPSNSIVKVIELDLLGNKELRVVRPDTIRGYIGERDTLFGEIKGNIFAAVESQLSPIIAKADPLLGNIDSLILNVNSLLKRNQEVIDASLTSLNRTINNFESISKEVDHLMASQTDNIEGILTDAKALTGSLAGNTGKIDSIMDNFNTLSSNLSELELEPVMKSAKSSLDEVEKLLKALNNAEGTLGKLVYDDGIANGLDSTLVAINALITDLMANPKRYVSFSLIERKDKD